MNEMEQVAFSRGIDTGIRKTCEEIHKHCLEKGMDAEDHKPYTEMIVFLNNKFGHVRRENT